MNTKQPFFVSIIIPTYNRAKMLGMTVESFVKQNYPKDQFELIIADNNSRDETKDVIAEWQSKSSVAIRYIFEKRQGVHYARNSAAKLAKGDILYFTDDDMLADEELIKNLIRTFSMDYNVASATGKVLPKWEVTPPEWILKLCNNYLLSLNDRVEQLIISPNDVGVFSCHQAVLKDVFFKSGGFNPENTAGEWIGDGETGLNIKIKELGYSFAYNGESVIYHMIPSSRMTQSYLNKRMANQGNCDSYTEYRKYNYNEIQLALQIFKYIIHISCDFLRLVPRWILQRDSWRLFLARVYYYRNRIKYDMRLIYDESWRALVLKKNWLEE